MKRLLSLCLLGVMTTLGTMAQGVTYDKNRFLDNWSVGINAGGTTTLHTGYNYWDNMAPYFGVQIGKEFTPSLGMTIEGNFAVNSTWSKTAIDNHNIALLGRVNLMNLFGKFTGERRLFEIEALAGVGWLYYYNTTDQSTDAWSFKTGLNFNFNVGKKKAWTIQIKPALVYNLSGIGYESYRGVSSPGSLSRNSAAMELGAGIVYHFKNSNGTHYFKAARLYDQAEVDALNDKVNDLRNELREQKDKLRDCHEKNARLRQDLQDCRNSKPKAEAANNGFEAVVSFRQGSSTIDATQMASVERLANYLKQNSSAKVVLKGYASPEGSKSWNKKLAQKRADKVKNVLVKNYGISADRIKAEGQGVGSIFSNPDWNRVTICNAE